MALDVKQAAKQLNTVGSPIFVNRDKGSWDDVHGTTQTVVETTMYTDSNGDTYGVVVFEKIPDRFFLCGKVATTIVETVCDPELGGTVDPNTGIMIDSYTIEIGVPKKTKTGGKTYLPVTLID